MAHWTWLRYATIFNRKTSFLGKFQSFWIFGMPLSSTENLFFGNILEYLVSHYFQQKTCFGEISEFLVFLAGLSLNFSRGDLLGQYSKSIFKKCFSCFDKGLAWGRKVVFFSAPSWLHLINIWQCSQHKLWLSIVCKKCSSACVFSILCQFFWNSTFKCISSHILAFRYVAKFRFVLLQEYMTL